jgi:aminotransferase
VAELLERHDAILVTDETYAYITRPGADHSPPATFDRLRDRTVTISSFSKTYAVTGWRVGYACAPRPLMAGIRKVHDFLTICAPAPFQAAVEEALKLPASYYGEMAAAYDARLALLSEGLASAGFRVNRPQGTYFLLVDVRDMGIEDDRGWSLRFAEERGVAGVPGSAFLQRGMPREDGTAPDRRGSFLRLSFGKSEADIEEAVRRLRASA